MADRSGLSFDSSAGLWHCAYCIDHAGLRTEGEIQEHANTKRHGRLREQYVEHGNSARGCIERLRDEQGKEREKGWVCTICSAALESECKIDGHLVGMKHWRNLRRKRWFSSELDPSCRPPMTVHCVGDSHGGKYLFQSMSPRVHCHFVTGTMYSFASGRRPVDLKRLGVRGGAEVDGEAVLFSYGEIDVRCHVERLSSERGCDYGAVIRPLVEQYVKRIVGYLSDFAEGSLVAVVLALPPPSDRNENPKVPYYGKLSERVVITRLFNRLLEAACGTQRNPDVHFFHPFASFTNGEGSLDHAYSDGHIHIRSQCCRPIHQQLTALLVRMKQQR